MGDGRMKLFDLHCDTLLCAYLAGKELSGNGLHVDLERAKDFEEYRQVLAVFSEDHLDGDSCYAQFDRVMDYYERLPRPIPSFHPIIGVEGGKLLMGDLARLDHLYERGVRILTLVWGEVSCMGGAFHTDVGLSEFGEQVVRRCFALGIVPDLSHASDPMIDRVLTLAEQERRAVIASHSNFRAICPHKRNLTDEQALRIARLGGVIGVNLVIPHLCSGKEHCDIDAVIDHIEYGIRLCGRDAVALGCDMDGTAPLPDGIEGVGDLPKLYEKLANRLGSLDLADAVFYENAKKALSRIL